MEDIEATAMQTTHLYYRVDRRRINLIRFIFEAYEGLAVVTTLDASRGIIGLAVAPGHAAMACSVMEDLSKQIRMEAVAEDRAECIRY